MANASRALQALGDPTRRLIFERLARGARSVGDIARGLTISRPAVSQHLAVLKAAGLVTDRADGTRRIYGVDPDGVEAVREWLDQFRARARSDFALQGDADPTHLAPPA